MIPAFASGAVLLLVDQWSKRTVQLFSPGGCISWGSVLRVKPVANSNRMYKRRGVRALLVLVWFTALVSATLLHRSGAWFQSQSSMLGLGLALGGAAGNLLDILRRHWVVDFVDLGWWPVFNLADVGIVGGLILAFWPRF